MPGRAGGAGVGRTGQVEQMEPFGLVELQGSRDGFKHAVGDSGQVAFLQPGVVVGADPGEHRDFLAA
jgi:hypothetical protein